MKKILLLLIASAALLSCKQSLSDKNTNDGISNSTETITVTTDETVSDKDCVEVLYFHGRQRCATCLAIEKRTLELLDEGFTEPMKSGKLLFRTIDISKEENRNLADKYEVTWSSLFVVRHKNREESVVDMTEVAFMNARKSPEQFKKRLADCLNEMLNNE